MALDAERASGYRYSQRAYLLQVRREGSGTHLIDPIAFDDLSELSAAFGDAEWILHAATQDLPCLAEIGLRPTSLFDTELAGRLLNLPRVGLASLVEHYLGLSLAKEFSAADWSTRPLPEPWLVYAALDVEVLVELRNLIDDELTASGKREWAAEEFEALLSFAGPPERVDPWRRTSGMHKARGRRSLALVRELWQARDSIAEARDTTPGRILPDASLVEIAMTAPQTSADLKQMRAMRNRGPRRFLSEWFDAVERGLALPDAELPTTGLRSDGPPPPRAWSEKNPEAAKRLARCRSVIIALSEAHDLPAENLITPQLVRNLAWEPPAPSRSTPSATSWPTAARGRGRSSSPQHRWPLPSTTSRSPRRASELLPRPPADYRVPMSRRWDAAMTGYRRPAMPGPQLFEAQADGADPAELAAAGHRIATLLVRGPARRRRRRDSSTACCTWPTTRVWASSPSCGRTRPPTPWPARCGASTCCAPGCTASPSRRPASSRPARRTRRSTRCWPASSTRPDRPRSSRWSTPSCAASSAPTST